MYRQIDNPHYWNSRGVSVSGDAIVAQPGQLDALMALERIGTRLSFARNDEIYAEDGGADVWYKVVSGTVRICKLLADGRRHIAEFCFNGDCFGIDITSERRYSAEAVDDAVVMRYQRRATERLVDRNPALARMLRDTVLRELTAAHGRAFLLARMTAPERVAAFLLEMCERRDRTKFIDLAQRHRRLSRSNDRNRLPDSVGVQARRGHRDCEPAPDRASRSIRARGNERAVMR